MKAFSLVLRSKFLNIKCFFFLIIFCFSGGFSAAALSDLSALASASKQVSSSAELNNLNTRLGSALAGDVAVISPDDLVLASEVLGNLTSKARELGSDSAMFKALITRADQLHRRSRDKVRMLERTAGENESALERLYRSDIWHDINYALSAAGYWKAWAALGYAGTLNEGDARVVWLNRANNGFKVASVRILYPGIVHGSWLGLGYVAQAQGDLRAAEKRFRRLAQALSASGDNPVRKLAEAELTMMAIRRGELEKLTSVPREALTPSLAGVLIEEAFLLLEQHRQRSSGAIAAGQRLKKVIADGFLTNALLARILTYRDEIVGQDLGVISLLIDAEFAYAYQQYLTTVLKYQQFRKVRGESLGVDTSPFQYHYAVAAMKTDLPDQAQAEIERLQRAERINPSVTNALPKFAFSVAQLAYQQRPGGEHRKRLISTAKAYIRSAPGDADIARAHLALAELSENPKDAERHLRAARADRNLKAEVALTSIRRDINRFNQATSAGDTKLQRVIAERMLSALGDLGRRKRGQAWFRAVSIQMRTVLGQDLSKQSMSSLSREIDELLADVSIADDVRVRSVLFWSKLRVLDAQGDGAALLDWIAQTTDASNKRQVYQFLLEKEKTGAYAQLVNLAAGFYPALQGQAQDQRQLRLLQIRSLSALGRSAEAFDLARSMVGEFADSGDAWQAYAEAAEKNERWFEAERAWVKIASATPEGSPRWREALVRQVKLLTGEQRDIKDKAQNPCRVIAQLVRYAHLLEPEQGQWLLQQQTQCGGSE